MLTSNPQSTPLILVSETDQSGPRKSLLQALIMAVLLGTLLLVVFGQFALITPAHAQSTVQVMAHVLDQTGQPVVNVPVRLTKRVVSESPPGVSYEMMRTDSDGKVSFAEPAGCGTEYELQAFPDEVVDDELLLPSGTASTCCCISNDIEPGNLIIQRPYQIQIGGYVRDQFGTPLEGIEVTMVRTKYNLNPSPVTTAKTWTDANGHYFFIVYSRCGVVAEMTALGGYGPSSTSGCVLFFNDGLDITVFLPSCDTHTLDRPPLELINSQVGWSMDAEVSSNDGLVLRDVKLGHRYMAKEISVPYFFLETNSLPLSRGELTQDGDAPYARSRLIDYSVSNRPDKLVIQATYVIDRIPTGSQSCLTITQRYEFYPAGVGCEPSETLPCAVFKPIMQYRFNGSGGEYLRSINIVQRDHFQANGVAGNASAVFQDCNLSPVNCILSGSGPIFTNKINPLFTEFTGQAINHGESGAWDNYHQTYYQDVDEPDVFPGCPECVHMHWRWGEYISHRGPQFGGGHPIIPTGSLQDVDVAVVRYHPGEEHPFDYHSLLNSEAVTTIIPGDQLVYSPMEVVFWYSATGRQAQDTFFTHGIFFNPSDPYVQRSAGDVSVTYGDLYEDGTLTATPIDPASAGTLPNGYVPYNNLAYEVATTAVTSGPHTVTFHVPSVADPALLASMRVFHGEHGVLVDRTFGSDFLNKTISAKVNSFSPFVIAVPVPTGSQLTSLGPAQMWVGLKNSDDVGTKFDLLAEVFKNGTLIGSGQLNDVAGGSSGFNNAKLDVVNLALPASVSFQAGDALKIKLSVRVAASSGHRSGTARLWFNDAAANSRFTATVGGVPGTYFLRSSFGLTTSAGSGPKTTIDVTVDRAVGGNPFKTFGTWSVTF